ncbi:MAG: hypothetical protein JWQ38_3270, partial [Flavipsychrobacter sp.]|nr:hypothetical protein [Flavipsychrobacter sp.]
MKTTWNKMKYALRATLLCSILSCMQTKGADAQIITRYAGSVGTYGYAGDGGPATSAYLSSIGFMKMDGIGNLYFTNSASPIGKVRVIDPSGVINTFATTWDGIVGVDAANDIYFADPSNNVYKVNHTTSVTTVVAGNGTSGFSGDGGAATNAQLSSPRSVA